MSFFACTVLACLSHVLAAIPGSALLQVQTSTVAKRPLAQQAALAEGLVQSVVMSGGKLSPQEKQVIDDMNNTLEQVTMPSILNESDIDQRQLQMHSQAAVYCTEETSRTSGATDTTKTRVQTLKAGHDTMLTTLSSSKKEQSTAQTNMDAFISSLSTGASAWCPLPSGTADLGNTLSGGADWYAIQYAEYSRLKGILGNVSSDVESKTLQVTISQTQLADDECYLRLQAAEAKKAKEECLKTIQLYSGTLKSAQANTKNRKDDWSSAKKIQCFLRALAGTANFAACVDMNVSTAHLDLSIPDYDPVEGEGTQNGYLSDLSDASVVSNITCSTDETTTVAPTSTNAAASTTEKAHGTLLSAADFNLGSNTASDGIISVTGGIVESKETYQRPLTVEASIRSSAGYSECVAMTVFASGNGKNDEISLEVGGWGDQWRIYPDDNRGHFGDVTAFIPIKVVLDESDGVEFYINGTVRYTTTSGLSSGKIKFPRSCVDSEIKDIRVM